MKKFISISTLVFGLLIFALHGTAFAADPFDAMGVLRPTTRMSAPAFHMKDVKGEQKALSDFKGKIIVLNFWATWCPNCREEMPALEKFWKKFKTKGVVVVAVSVDKNPDQVKSFVKSFGLTFPVLLDTNGDVRTDYEVTALPITYIIGKDGKMSGKIYGGRDWAGKDASALMKYLLKQ